MPHPTKFCVKSPNKQEPREALESLLTIGGDVLFLGYGYIGYRDAPVEYFERIVKWLAASHKRSVHIYVGILPDPKLAPNIGISKRVAEVTTAFQILLKDEIYAKAPTDRIWVSAVAGMHCKFALCCSTDACQQLVPLAGMLGSSNLTQSALKSTRRLELDLFIAGADPLLQQFTAAIMEIIDEAEKLEVHSFGEDVRKRIYYAPALREAEDDAKAEAMREITHYWNQGMSRVEREARMESDEQQEISSWKPGLSS